MTWSWLPARIWVYTATGIFSILIASIISGSFDLVNVPSIAALSAITCAFWCVWVLDSKQGRSNHEMYWLGFLVLIVAYDFGQRQIWVSCFACLAVIPGLFTFQRLLHITSQPVLVANSNKVSPSLAQTTPDRTAIVKANYLLYGPIYANTISLADVLETMIGSSNSTLQIQAIKVDTLVAAYSFTWFVFSNVLDVKSSAVQVIKVAVEDEVSKRICFFSNKRRVPFDPESMALLQAAIVRTGDISRDFSDKLPNPYRSVYKHLEKYDPAGLLNERFNKLFSVMYKSAYENLADKYLGSDQFTATE